MKKLTGVTRDDDGTVTAYIYARHSEGEPYIREPELVKIHPNDLDWRGISSPCQFEEPDAVRCRHCLAPAVYRCQACLNPLDMEVIVLNDTKGYEGMFILCGDCTDKLWALIEPGSMSPTRAHEQAVQHVEKLLAGEVSNDDVAREEPEKPLGEPEG